jgi:hypothetical protein
MTSPDLQLRLLLLLAALAACGCTINKSRMATEQLVVSDAVDRVVAQTDFSPLTGQKVYFETKYLTGAKITGNPNIEYLTSSLRQQMLAYDCRLVDKPEEADLIVEARVGALGNDGNEATYGIPGSAAVSAAAAFATGFPASGTFPELSLGRRNHQWGAAKIGLFAYDRVSHQRVWQAGVATGASQARELWVMGIGPFQQGRVYRQAQTSMNDGPKQVKNGKHLNKLEPLDAYAADIDFQGEPKKLPTQQSVLPQVPRGNQSNSQVLPVTVTDSK